LISHPDYSRRRLLRTSERLRAQLFSDPRAVDSLEVAGPVDRISWDDAQALDYRPAELGERFGPLWATYWFRVRATVPDEWRGERVELLWASDSEATLWRDGRVLAGLNRHHAEATVADSAEPGGLELDVELACNGLFGRQDRPVELTRCELVRWDAEAWTLFHDFELLRQLEAHPATDPALSAHLRVELERFCNSGDRSVLAALYELHNADWTHEVAAVGHAHIDTAWLWPLAETYRKTLRTFSTAVRYMDEYPEYRFA